MPDTYEIEFNLATERPRDRRTTADRTAARPAKRTAGRAAERMDERPANGHARDIASSN